MAEVWLARQRGPMGFEKLVAIKRLLPHLQDQDPFVRMFLDEARIAARINHANVVQIYDLGEADESYYIAMEYLLGESLARVMGEGLKRDCPLPELLGAAVVAQMCKGLHHAHTLCDARGQPLGIVHRDVSPQNVVLLYDGAVKLLDFGIAKARQRLTETTTTGMKGKYAYMSPEQCLGEPVDHRSDIFACGVVLWELLTRRRLFKHQNKLTMLRMISEGQVAPPGRLNPALPSELDEITLRALAKRPDERYQTAEELSLALEEVVASHGISAATAKIAEYLGEAFGEDLERRKEFANIVTLDEPLGEPAEHWLDLLPEPTGEIVSLSGRSPVAATSAGRPPSALPRTSQRWWMATALVALLAALATLGAFLFSTRTSSRCGLIVESSPAGAALGVDGISAGQRTPAALEKLSCGVHRVELSLAGHRPWLRSLVLRGGETLRLDVMLQPLAASSQPPGQALKVAAAAPAPRLATDTGRTSSSRAAAPIAAHPPRPRAASEHGLLNLATVPWATIYHGRRKLGDTPLVGVRLPAGQLSLTAVNPEEGIRTSITVEIKKGQTVRKSLRLR